MRYSLRQLEVFLAVAHCQNITRAAASLSMSQSAASSALRELEQQFSIQLFDRHGKRLQINEMGRSLRPMAEALLERAREVERQLAGQQVVGELKIGATLTIGNYLAVELIARFIQQHHSQVSLSVANTAEIARQLENFNLDVGLVEGELQHPELELLPWRRDELVVFCAPRHPLAAVGRLSDQDLLQAQWILREPGSGTRQAFDRAMVGILPKPEGATGTAAHRGHQARGGKAVGHCLFVAHCPSGRLCCGSAGAVGGAAAPIRPPTLPGIASAEVSQCRHRKLAESLSRQCRRQYGRSLASDYEGVSITGSEPCSSRNL